MAWDTGTITDSGPHTVLSQKIKDLCGDTGVANWSFVENIPAGTSAGQSGTAFYSVDVFKCKGSGTDANAAGIDWYVGFAIPVSDGAVGTSVLVAEDYLNIVDNGANADRGKFKRPANMGSGALTTVPTGTGYWISDTYGTFASYQGSRTGSTNNLNTSGFTYYIKMTNNAIWVTMLVGTAEDSWSAMLLDSLTSVSDPCPLVAQRGAVAGGPSRLPSVVTSGVTNMWRVNALEWNNLFTVKTTSNAANSNDIWQGNKIFVSRVLLYSTASGGSGYQIGMYRGLMKPDFLQFSSGGTVVLGDTMVIDGNTWTVIATNANAYWGQSTRIWIVRAN